MRIRIVLFISCACFILKARAQQNYFNVPSGEITEKNKLFAQLQSNFTSSVMQNNLTLDMGLGHKMELGFNIFSLDTRLQNLPTFSVIKNPDIPLAPLYLLNFQKGISAGNWDLSLGVQAGGNQYSNHHPAWWQYGLAKRKIGNNGPLITCGYYAGNHQYLGYGNHAGFMFGTEQKLFETRKQYSVKLNADVISGRNAIAVCVPGLVFSWKDKFLLSAGAQLPVASDNPHAFVVEFTYHP